MGKRAVLYARVSTDEQGKGYSLPSQIDAMRKYAAQQGFEIVAEFQEDFSGATPLELRPEGKKAYTMLSANQADAIIGYTVDRLVRPPEDGDEWDFPVLIRGLAKLGKEIHVCDLGKLKTDFASLLIAMLGAKGAGDERRKILERTTRGRNHKAQLYVVGSGHPPYGYQFVKDANGKTISLAIVDSEGRIVRLIFTSYVKDRLPLRAIARKLSVDKINTPGESRGIKRKRGAGMWNDSTVRSILCNETYAGTWHYLKVARTGNHSEPRPDREQFAVQVPAIIGRELFEAARARLKYNQHMSKRNAKYAYLLRGRIKCGCGAAMQGKHTAKHGYEYFYYECTQNVHHHAELESICRERSVRREVAEQTTWDYVENLFRNKELFEQALTRAQKAELDSLAPKRERLEVVEGLLVECEREADALAEAVKKVQGGLVGQKLEKQIEDAEERYAELAKERDELQAGLSAQKLTDEAMNEARRFRADVADGMKHPTLEDKYMALELLGAQVTVKDRKVQVALAFLSVMNKDSACRSCGESSQ